MATVEAFRRPLQEVDAEVGADTPAARPRSATSEPTALAGLATAVVAMVLLRGVDMAVPLKAFALVAVTAAPMALIALFRPNDDLRPATANQVNVNRLLRKLIGFWATIGALYGAYSVLPEYAGGFYASSWTVARALLPWLTAASPLYIFYLDRRQREPEDAYAQLGALLTAQNLPASAWSTLANHARGWMVKGFFLPLMFVYLANDLDGLWHADLAAIVSSFQTFFDFSVNALYLIDLLFAAVGYTLTLRLLDSEIRSAEPTLTGWLVCLVCYQPFWSVIGTNYLRYEGDNFYWGDVAGGHPVLYVAWGLAILFCLAVYALSTVSFGLRFSNLTHRGIITTGPYRFTKHPAYISKCVSFWLISVPFLSNHGVKAAIAQSLLLLASNGIYLARAITEERHLARDPVYRAYQAHIREHGIFARLRLMTAFERMFAAGTA
jgi:protein-S-isoprenylcysteine O-methyltransferase Ste14